MNRMTLPTYASSTIALALFLCLPLAKAPAADEFEEAIPNITAQIEPATARRGQTVTLKISMDISPGWHTYPSKQVDPKAEPYKNEFQFPDSPHVVFVSDLKNPPALSKADPALGVTQLDYYEGQAVWERPVVVRPNAQPGEKNIDVTMYIVVCDANHCLPPKKIQRSAKLTILDTEPVAVEDQFRNYLDAGATSAKRQASVEKATNPSNAPSTTTTLEEGSRLSAESPEAYRQILQNILSQLDRQAQPNTGLLSFMLTGMFWGAVSLLTPCVFPMIPITVSFFLKQSEKEHYRPLTLALVYCGTIIIVLTAAAVLLLSFFRLLSVNPIMNFAMGLLFVYFALSLFGMYEIELPAGLARFTSVREGAGGMVGTVFMALTFTILSFACVAPFLGGFGGTATGTGHGLGSTALGGLAFATTFAAPFFFLALFPSLLKKLPKSGTWLNSVKVVMGFLELAAALKFLRAGELVLRDRPSFFTYDFVLGIWIVLCILCGLYLLQVYRLPHDTPVEHLSVPRLLFSMAFLSLGVYLAPALFKYTAGGESQRPSGVVYAWVDSFLLPEPIEAKSILAWGGDLQGAIDRARAERVRTGQRKLVFVDFTGETCTNCKINERSVFSKPDFQELFRPYQRVQLYTDKVPNEHYTPQLAASLGGNTGRQRDDAQVNLWFQKQAFGTEQLPLYVILEPMPNGRIVELGRYEEGKINDEAAFAQFLRSPLLASGQVAFAGKE